MAFNETSADPKVNISHNVTTTAAQAFPLSLVLNYTSAGDNEISSLNFESKTAQKIDEGAVFDIQIGNSMRKNGKTLESWFNFDQFTN